MYPVMNIERAVIWVHGELCQPRPHGTGNLPSTARRSGTCRIE